MIHILSVIAPLFLLILLGAALYRIGVANDEWSRSFNQFALKVGLPALVFVTLFRADVSFLEELPIILANSVFILITFALAYTVARVLRLHKKTRRTLFICAAFGNVAYLGIPLLTQVSGQGILPEASLIVAIYLFWLFTVGVGYLELTTHRSGTQALRNSVLHMARNPLLISVALGLILGALKLPLPDVILRSLDMVASAVTPTVLLVIGFFVGKSSLGDWREWIAPSFFALFTLVALPALFWLATLLFGLPLQPYLASLIQAAMPLAITPFALAKDYDLDQGFIARSIVMSTVLSAVTLPFWIFLF